MKQVLPVHPLSLYRKIVKRQNKAPYLNKYFSYAQAKRIVNKLGAPKLKMANSKEPVYICLLKHTYSIYLLRMSVDWNRPDLIVIELIPNAERYPNVLLAHEIVEAKDLINPTSE